MNSGSWQPIKANAQVAVARRALTAEAGRKLIEAQRAELELRRSKTEVKAPRAGLILSRNAVVGQIASAGGNPLFTIAERVTSNSTPPT